MFDTLKPLIHLAELVPVEFLPFIIFFCFFVFACRWGEKRHLLCRLEASQKLKRLKGKKPDVQMGYLRRVNPFVFEEMVLTAIRKKGHSIVRNKRYTGDGGIDGRCTINGVEYLIQAKRYSGHINPAHVQDFSFICQRRGKKGLFVHTGKTGPKSRKVARDTRLEMISGDRLLNLLLDKPKVSRSNTL